MRSTRFLSFDGERWLGETPRARSSQAELLNDLVSDCVIDAEVHAGQSFRSRARLLRSTDVVPVLISFYSPRNLSPTSFHMPRV